MRRSHQGLLSLKFPVPCPLTDVQTTKTYRTSRQSQPWWVDSVSIHTWTTTCGDEKVKKYRIQIVIAMLIMMMMIMTRIIWAVGKLEQAARLNKKHNKHRTNKVAIFFSFDRNHLQSVVCELSRHFPLRWKLFLGTEHSAEAVVIIWNVFQTSLSHLHFCLYCCLVERTPFIATSARKR